MAVIAIDIGTTHCKAGLFLDDGSTLKIAHRFMETHKTSDGWAYFDPAELIQIVRSVLEEITKDNERPISCLGIASMAETGLLIDSDTGKPSTPLIPWFETKSQPFVSQILEVLTPLECYVRFGLKVNYKASIAKILWLLSEQDLNLNKKRWLSVADFVAYQLTKEMGTDYSLAGRTLAFRMDDKTWDKDWLRYWDIPTNIFPPAQPSGSPVGLVTENFAGVKKGTPISICGHDHVCAALATGTIEQGIVFDSMGTAETLIGVLPDRKITEEDFYIGLQYGFHVVDGLRYWMGGNSASGGSVEWMRRMISSKPLSYDDVESLIEQAKSGPTGILYFPYLLGSGSPHTNSNVSGAFIGMKLDHKPEDIFKAIFEGIAYEMELVRRAGEKMSGLPIKSMVAAGGGTKSKTWMQIKADITGCEIKRSKQEEATLLGAAMTAGIGNGLFKDAYDAVGEMCSQEFDVFVPQKDYQKIYQRLFTEGYLMFQDPLSNFSNP